LWLAMQSKQFEPADFKKSFRLPIIFLRRKFDFVQHGANVNRFTKIFSQIFAKPLHAEVSRKTQGGCKEIYSSKRANFLSDKFLKNFRIESLPPKKQSGHFGTIRYIDELL
jgi:hypothetical protein